MDNTVPGPHRLRKIGIGLSLSAVLLLAGIPAAGSWAEDERDIAPHFGLPDNHPDLRRPPKRGLDAVPPERRTPRTAQVPKRAAPHAAPAERAKRLDELYAKLKAATDPVEAAPIANAIEQLWQISGSPTAELLVARAVEATGANKRDLALKLLDAAVELQPDYAEAWNRRAYVFYLGDDYKRALGDLRRVLALEPRHYKALEGLAQIMKSIGEKKGALAAYDNLIAIYPAMPGAKQARDELSREVEGQGI